MRTCWFDEIEYQTATKECLIDNTMYQTLEDAVIQLEKIYNSPEFDDESDEKEERHDVKVDYYIETYTLKIND